MAHYFRNVLVGLDQLANALLAGDPDETISGRMGKAILRGDCWICRPLCWMLDRLDPRPDGHCLRAIEADEGRDELL